METKKSLNELLDFKEVNDLFKYFSVLTGLNVALYDQNGKQMLAVRSEGTVCGFFDDGAKCRELIVYGGKKSAELGSPYIYNCACGLIMCSSPVLIGDSLLGSIACGPAMLWEADEFAERELSEKLSLMGGKGLNAGELMKNIKSLDCFNMTAAAQLLFIAVNSICKNNLVILSERAEIARQQSQISSLILEKKTRVEASDGKIKLVSYPYDTEKELISFVRSGNKRQAKRILNELLSGIFLSTAGNTDSIRARVFELIAFLGRAASDNGADIKDVDAIIKDSIGILNGGTGFEELCSLTGAALERLIDIVYYSRGGKTLSAHLTKAIDFIAENYPLNINLPRVAGEVFVSTYYLSHLFRDELDTTFSDYLTKFRIEKAKELLKDKSLQIQDVTEKTGFNDANYFTKTFKKHTGVTPKEYRSMFY